MNHQFFQGAGRTGDSSKYVEELTKLMALEKNIRFLMQTMLPGSREEAEARALIETLPEGEMKDSMTLSFPASLELNAEKARQIAEWDRNPQKQAEDGDPFGDGDQSPLKGAAAIDLRSLWSDGMDWRPDRLDPFNYACFLGLMDLVRTTWEATPPNKRWELLELRHSRMRFAALHNVVAGSMRAVMFRGGMASSEQDHVGVARFLCQQGARVDAKDVIGMTPLHHSLSMHSNDISFEIAKVLIENGANVNAQNRQGGTPMYEPVHSRNTKLVKFLLDHGADASLKDNDGHQVMDWALLDMRGIISDNLTERMRRRAAEGYCRGCDQLGKFSCSRCQGTKYCSKECQKADWKLHKKTCRAPGEEVEVLLNLNKPDHMPKGSKISNNATGQLTPIGVRFHKLKPEGVRFPIKVQYNASPSSKQLLLLYDEPDRAIVRSVHLKDPNVDAMVDMIKAYGLSGKMYFPAYVDRDRVLHIVLRDAHEDALTECRRLARANGAGEWQLAALQITGGSASTAGSTTDTPPPPTPKPKKKKGKKKSRTKRPSPSATEATGGGGGGVAEAAAQEEDEEEEEEAAGAGQTRLEGKQEGHPTVKAEMEKGGAAVGAEAEEEEEEEEEECAICSHPLVTGLVTVPCSHIFHRQCALLWKTTCESKGAAYTCPMCRDEKFATVL